MPVLLLLLFSPVHQPPNLEEIQKNVVESRQAIHSGEIEILEKKKSRTDSKKPFDETSFTWKIARDGEKGRGEFLTHKGFREGVRKVAVVNGDVDGWGFFHEALPGVVAHFGPIKKAPNLLGKQGAGWIAADFQALGTTPYELSHSVGLDLGWLLHECNLKRFPYTIREENLDGKKQYRFSGSGQPAKGVFSLEFTILPDQGWTFGSIRTRGKDFENRLEIQHQKTDGIWFPKTMKFQQFGNGDLMTEEEVTVQVKSLNKPIANETFLIQSLKLKDPTVVSQVDGGFLVWTKGKLILYDDYQAMEKPPKGIPDKRIERDLTEWSSNLPADPETTGRTPMPTTLLRYGTHSLLSVFYIAYLFTWILAEYIEVAINNASSFLVNSFFVIKRKTVISKTYNSYKHGFLLQILKEALRQRSTKIEIHPSGCCLAFDPITKSAINVIPGLYRFDPANPVKLLPTAPQDFPRFDVNFYSAGQFQDLNVVNYKRFYFEFYFLCYLLNRHFAKRIFIENHVDSKKEEFSIALRGELLYGDIKPRQLTIYIDYLDNPIVN